ncbi:MAG: 5-bromo-4-chloroindolyl phosphate hydrolysis family protein [Roseburia sp.]|nr:5-bromo-4-chloroindolyl phosphate hydrolysis family protein [Roseburia sp.]
MNDYQNWSRAGEQIKDAVTDALQSGDFSNLNHLVSQTVVNTLDEVGIHITQNDDYLNRKGQYTYTSFSKTEKTQTQAYSQAQPYPQTNVPPRQQQTQGSQRQEKMQAWQKQTRQQPPRQSVPVNNSLNANLSFVKMKKVGNVSSVLYQVFGGIGLGITGIVTFIRLLALAADATSPFGWIVNIAFLALFFGMIHLGISQKKRLKRAERYVTFCDYRMFGEIKTLAKNTGKKESYVIKDLQKMLKLGIFPEGHLDEQNTCFMLNDVVYRQYLEVENNRIQREEASRKSPEPKGTGQASKASSAPEELHGQESELNTMVAEGMEYIRKLRDLNDQIAGEVISAKLFRLESLLKEIFDRIREHPEQMHRMHKLMDYYLPTILKLVEAYEEFDQISTPGEEIIKAKAEIENTLDTINQAFSELLNNLFQDTVFDVTTDAQVLKTMLAREGLTQEMEFAPNKRES